MGKHCDAPPGNARILWPLRNVYTEGRRLYREESIQCETFNEPIFPRPGATGPCRFRLGADSARKTLLQQPNLHSGHRVLDIGCGTGTFVALIKRIHPEVSVVGLDPDPKALARAKKKAARSGVSIQFDQQTDSAVRQSFRAGH